MKKAGKLFLAFLLGSAAASAVILVRDEWRSGSGRSAAVPSPKKRERIPARQASVRGAIALKSGALQSCYESHLASAPAVAAGSLRVGWRIEPDGAVAEVATVSSDFGSPDFEACVLDRIRSWSFGPVSSGEPVRVAHKFTFRQRTPASLEFGQ